MNEVTIVGTVTLSYSVGEKTCICCPDLPAHVHAMHFELPVSSIPGFPRYFEPTLDRWLKTVFDFKRLDDRRIRITAELLDADDGHDRTVAPQSVATVPRYIIGEDVATRHPDMWDRADLVLEDDEEEDDD